MRGFTIFTVFWVFAFLVFNLMYVADHEKAHRQINTYYGADSETRFIGRGAPETVTTTPFYEGKRWDAMDKHSLNEIVAYNVVWLSNALLLGVYLFCFYKEVHNE